MPKKIIHIGLHKTSTTFLQNKIFPNIENYTFITRPYTQCNHAFNKLQYADDSLYDKNLVIEELKKNNLINSNLILSDESFSGKPFGYSYLNRSLIAKRLKELFPEATILIFIRDQIDIIKSFYSSYIKMPYGVKNIKQFIWKPGISYDYETYKNDKSYPPKASKYLYFNTDDYHLHLDGFLYTNLINLYKNLFKDVRVFLYEDFVYRPDTIIKELENITGEHIDIDSEVFKTKSNTSISYASIKKKKLFNKLSSLAGDHKIRRYIAGAYRFFPFPSFSNKNLGNEVRKIVQDYYKENNQKLKEMLPYIEWDKHPDKYH